jgi:hypothetical protein
LIACHSCGATTAMKSPLRTRAPGIAIDARRRARAGVRDGRPQRPRVQHSGQAHVMAVLGRRHDFAGDVLARHGRADDAVVVRALRLGNARDVQVVAVALVPIELRLETVGDELAVRHGATRGTGREHAAVRDAQIRGRHAEPLARARDEHAPRFGCRVA